VAKLILPAGGRACSKGASPAKEHVLQLGAYLWKRSCCRSGTLLLPAWGVMASMLDRTM